MNKASNSKLKSTLSLFDTTAIGLGAIIGGGIFIVTGIVAGLAGPALVISIIIAAAISLFTALSFVELTAWLPAEGSVYEFAHKLVSPFAGFIVGWMWIISNIFSGAAVSLGFSHYLVALFPFLNYRLVAAFLCIGFTLLNYLGIKHSALFNNILVLAKLSILLIFISVGIFHINPANFSHFVKSEMGIFHGAYFIFFAFAGFARPAIVAEEVKDAKRVVPKSIMLALAISTIIYILVGSVALGLVGAGILGKSNSPLAAAIGAVQNPMLVYIVSLGGMLATASVLLTSILGISRMVFAMARGQDLPHVLSSLHPVFNTPYRSILIVGVMITLISLFFNLAGVVAVSTFASLFYYALANASALKLKPEHKLYSKIFPTIGLAMCIMLLVFIEKDALKIAAICLLIGVLYYVGKKKFKI